MHEGTQSHFGNFQLRTFYHPTGIIFLTWQDRPSFLKVLHHSPSGGAKSWSCCEDQSWALDISWSTYRTDGPNSLAGIQIEGWILIPLKPLARVPLLLVRSHCSLLQLLGDPSIQDFFFFFLNGTKLREYWLVWIETKTAAMKKKNSLWKNKITSYNYSVLSRYYKNIRFRIWTYIIVLALSATLEFLTCWPLALLLLLFCSLTTPWEKKNRGRRERERERRKKERKGKRKHEN